MCYHSKTRSTPFQELSNKMYSQYSLVPITLRGKNGQEYSMFVNPNRFVCVQRAVTDLRNWHPNNNGFNTNYLMAIGIPTDLNKIESIPDRKTPDNFDVPLKNVTEAYAKMRVNGYVS